MSNQIAKQALKKNFGYDSFRPLQEEVIGSIVNKKDTLVIMPSGGGKSICYQLPAIISDGITIVVSPLIALMKDQVDSLLANGIPAAFINSSLSNKDQKTVMNKATRGELKLLYASPERLINSEFIGFLESLNINIFAIDEAHCISSWGHDFRPEYSKLSILKDTFPEVPLIALTATADKLTRNDICEQLKLEEPAIFIDSFDRPNLSLNVMPAKNRFAVIQEFIAERDKQSGIIYCLSRKSTEQLSRGLNNIGVKSIFYHAGMNSEDRNKAQEDFIKDDVQVICATIAFGMGIDKSNVRWIIHYNLPKNLEGYYQEIGRAGRDGLKSDTLLFYSFGDVVTLRKFASDSGQAEIQLAKLERMQQYAEAAICRRKILLSYFNEILEENCGNCDVCNNPPISFDGTIIAQKALSAITRLNGSAPSGLLIDILRGSGRREIMERNYHTIKTYGIGKDISFFDWQQYLLQMLHQGLIEIAYDENRNLKLTEASNKVLYEKKDVKFVKLVDYEQFKKEQQEKTKRLTKKERLESDMFEQLRRLRKKIADESNVAAYIIFSDQTLKEMAALRPTSYTEMMNIPGVGEHKFDQYGEEFINEIVRFKIHEKDRGSTHLQTYGLYKQGYSIDEIAKERNLNNLTIVSHLAALYEKGENINLRKFISDNELDKIEKALHIYGYNGELKKYFNHFKGEIDYSKIRLGLSFFKRSKTEE